jgi:Lipocalin-like domain
MIGTGQYVSHASKLAMLPEPGPGKAHGVRPRSRPDTDGTIAESILGNWRMVSWQIEDLASGETQDALGTNPHGYVTYTPDGRVMVLVLKADRARPVALVPTAGEKLALYDSMFAYAGTFTADAEKVVHHIDMSWNQCWTGTDQIRFLRLQEDRLTYVGAPARNPMNGRECVHTVVFQRSS